MADRSSGFKAFLGGVASNAVWELLKGIGGTAIVSATLLALLRYLRHRPVDWWGVLILSLASGVVVFLSLRKSRQHELTLSEEFDRKLTEQRTEILGQVPSFMVNGVPVAGPALAAKESPTHQLPGDQKLKIISAIYGPYKGKGLDVTDVLRGLITSNTLAVLVNNDLFGDPSIGKAKRLQVSYSYGSPAVVKIERRESDLMVLPEDTFLKEQAQNNHEPLFSPLQMEVFTLHRKLRSWHQGLSDAPVLDQSLVEAAPEELERGVRQRAVKINEWSNKIGYEYADKFSSEMTALVNCLGAKGLDVSGIAQYSGSYDGTVTAIKALEKLFFEIEEK